MRKSFDSSVPCRRVIRPDGCPGSYNRGGEEAKRKLLEKEGVWFDDRGRVFIAEG
ncbi:MAG: MGMT family protein [Candidatus Moranbacteria bacterium]|nr:MGMT family protein [Candidatus Moranbacteria bacterium]